jgi:multidrug resistance efflux pump
VHQAGPLEEFSGLGFGLVRSFLWWILGMVGLLAGTAALLSWHFSMDVSALGRGMIRPRQQRPVKAEIGGMVRQIAVRQGYRVEKGEVLARLDEGEWQMKIRQVDKDLEINHSRRLELEGEIHRERETRQAEMVLARLEMERAALHLEQVRFEHQSAVPGVLAALGWKQRPLDQLLPVQQHRAALEQRQAELALAEDRLRLVESRWQELRTLNKAREKLLEEKGFLRDQLEKTVVRAPVEGVVLSKDVEKREGDRVLAGETLLEMAGPGGWQAEVLVLESDVPRVKKGQRVRLYVEAFPHMEYKIFSGEVEEVALQPAGEGAGYPVKVSIADPEVMDRGQVYALASGMKVEARIVVEKGRIAALWWRKLLRSFGKVDKGDLYQAVGS